MLFGIGVFDGAVVANGIINSPKGQILVNGSKSAVGIEVGPGSVVGNGIRNSGLVDVVQSHTTTANNVGTGLRTANRSSFGQAVGILMGRNTGVLSLDALPVASGSDIFVTGGIANSGELDVASFNSVSVVVGGGTSGIGNAVASGEALGIGITGPGKFEAVVTPSGTVFDLVSVEGGIDNSGVINVKSQQIATVSAAGQVASAGAQAIGQAVGIDIAGQALFGPVPFQPVGGALFEISGGIDNSGLINVSSLARASANAVAAGAGANAQAQSLAVGAAGGILAGPNFGGPLLVASPLISATSGLFISGGIINSGSITVNGVIGASSVATSTGTGPVSATASAEAEGFAGGILVDANEIDGDVLNSSRSSIDVFNQVNTFGSVSASGGTGFASVVGAAFVEAVGMSMSATAINGDVSNKGLIDVQQRVTGTALAHAVGTGTGGANAQAQQEALAFVGGLHASAAELNGNLNNSGTVTALGVANLVAVARATGTNGPVNASAAGGLEMVVSGVGANSNVHDGIVENSGAIDAQADVIIRSSALANGLEGGATADATAGGAAFVSVSGLVDSAGLTGGASNSGDITASGLVRMDTTATASGTRATANIGTGEFGSSNVVHLSVLGMGVFADSISGGVGNSGSIHAIGTAVVSSKADTLANGTGTLALAQATNDVDVSVRAWSQVSAPQRRRGQQGADFGLANAVNFAQAHADGSEIHQRRRRRSHRRACDRRWTHRQRPGDGQQYPEQRRDQRYG